MRARCGLRDADCWNRPVGSAPGAQITVLERVSKDYNQTFELTGRGIRCLNLGSYNYLGFGENSGPCIEAVRETIGKFGVCACAPVEEKKNVNIAGGNDSAEVNQDRAGAPI